MCAFFPDREVDPQVGVRKLPQTAAGGKSK
jgi:hypothetical protein